MGRIITSTGEWIQTHIITLGYKEYAYVMCIASSNMALLFQWINYNSIDTIDIQANLPSVHRRRQHNYSQLIAYCVCSSVINQCTSIIPPIANNVVLSLKLSLIHGAININQCHIGSSLLYRLRIRKRILNFIECFIYW